jgi:hypothetical protein
MANYNFVSVKANYAQKSEYLDDLLESGHSLEVFIGQALHRLTWRELQLIGNHMAYVKSNQEDQAYGFRTDEETVDA